MATKDTLTQIDAFLKYVYPTDTIIEQMNMEYELLKNIRLETENVIAGGKAAVIPLEYGQNGNAGSRDEDEDVPAAGSSNYYNAIVKFKYHYIRGYVTNQTLELAAGGDSSFAKFITEKVEGMQRTLLKDLNWKLFNSSTGIRTLVNGSVSNNANVVVYSTVGLRVGQKIDIYNATNTTVQAEGVEILDINESTKTLILDTNVTVDNNAYIYQAGEKDKSMNGLVDCLATSGTIHGINKATYSWWQGSVVSSSSVTINAKILTDMRRIAWKNGAKPKYWVTTPEIYDQIFLHLLKQDQRYTEVEIAGGFKSISYHGYTFLPDIDCPSGYIFLIDPSMMEFEISKSKFHWLEGETGRLIPVSGKDSYEMLLKCYCNLFVKRPKAIPYAYNISES